MVKAIGNVFAAKNNEYSVRQRTIDAGKRGLVIGAVAGAIEGYTRKSWLSHNKPSDTFVKQVSINLEGALKPEQHKELERVNNFFAALVDKETPLNDFRKRIEKSSELTNALPRNEGEDTKTALDRIFSNPDEAALRKKLKGMQNRTEIDKKVDLRAAKKLANDNFNSEKKILQKSANTAEETFKLLEKAVKKIRVKTARRETIIGGVLMGTIGMFLGASSINNK